MPKVVVYVPAATWRRLEERVEDPAAFVRDAAKRGCEIRITEEALLPPPDLTPGATDDVTKELRQMVSSSRCPMNTPRGTKCKACGKVH